MEYKMIITEDKNKDIKVQELMHEMGYSFEAKGEEIDGAYGAISLSKDGFIYISEYDSSSSVIETLKDEFINYNDMNSNDPRHDIIDLIHVDDFLKMKSVDFNIIHGLEVTYTNIHDGSINEQLETFKGE